MADAGNAGRERFHRMDRRRSRGRMHRRAAHGDQEGGRYDAERHPKSAVDQLRGKTDRDEDEKVAERKVGKVEHRGPRFSAADLRGRGGATQAKSAEARMFGGLLEFLWKAS